MSTTVDHTHGLEVLGTARTAQVHRNLSTAALYEAAIRRREGILEAEGPLVCHTGQHTGRSPNDKFLVREASSEHEVHWGSINQPIDPEQFALLYGDMMTYLQDKELYVVDAWAGADPSFRMPIRVVTELAWHALFARNMFIPEVDRQAARAPHRPEFTIIDAPGFKGHPARHGLRSDVFIVLHLSRKLVLIGGTSYAGEIKKSVFTILNYMLPRQGVLPMHCSANVGATGDTALFFGLSGTGKTTLASDPNRCLIGDDEHGWSSQGIFNFEGGCYAKLIRLSADAEPQIYAATHRFGSILENVFVDPDTRVMNLDYAQLTENTRGSYPITFIDNAVPSGRAGHPPNIVMLTADAYGVLPPVARLSADAAMYHFLSGYTARVAGTERGVTEPKATFSACFGAPFLPRHPQVYAEMFGERIASHQARVWLVNTGWIGGPYGVGSRITIDYSRAIITAALAGHLDHVEYRPHPIFKIDVPTACPDVPDSVLDPRGSWTDPAAYDEQATKLAAMFVDNFAVFEEGVAASVKAAGPAT